MYMNEDGELVVKLINVEFEYKDIDRELTKTTIIEIKLGSTLDEITEEIGEPNGWHGSGRLSPYYLLKKEPFKKQQYAILIFQYLDEGEKLDSIVLVDAFGVVKVLKSL